MEISSLQCRQPEILLRKLYFLLRSGLFRPIGARHWHSQPVIAAGYEEAFSTFKELHESDRRYVVKEIIRYIQSAKREEFRICSVGCGDGNTDTAILSEVKQACPDVALDYLGVDVHECSCLAAQDKLADHPALRSFVIRHTDFKLMNTAELPKFDFVQIIHSMRYPVDKKAFLAKALKMVRPNTGKMVIVSSDELSRTPAWHLSAAFRSGHACTSHFHYFGEHLLQDLEEMGVPYTVTPIPGYCDLSRCVREGFDSIFSRGVLNFLCNRRLEAYPQQVADLCVMYLRSAMDERHRCSAPDIAVTVTRPDAVMRSCSHSQTKYSGMSIIN